MDAKIGRRGEFSGSATGTPEALGALKEVTITHIRMGLIVRLGLYALAGLFLITAALLVVFAPDGRETVTGVIAAALLVLALGAAGYGAFRFKAPFVDLTTTIPEPPRKRKSRSR